MNGKNSSSIEINIASVTKTKMPETIKRSGDVKISCKGWVSILWEFCKEDRNRVIFSLKVGLAVLLVSLLILVRAPYKEFGTSIIWSILTVAIMFEYTVGMCIHIILYTVFKLTIDIIVLHVHIELYIRLL